MNQKHISMELTGEGARVTSLRLEDGKLVLTIEAQLADSHLVSGDFISGDPDMQGGLAPSSPFGGAAALSAAAPAPVPPSAPKPEPEPAPIAVDAESIDFAPPAPSGEEIRQPFAEPVFSTGVVTLTDESLSFAAAAPEPARQFRTRPPQSPALPPAPQPEAEAEDDQTNIWGDLSVMSVSEESSALGGARHGEPQPAISFGQDYIDPLFSLPPSAEQKPEPEPEPLPAPEPAPPPEADDKSAAEAGGTTVLIRYTCPKCKTQGMQAVDKVGTVVNCSNCGKAMRLVMKK